MSDRVRALVFPAKDSLESVGCDVEAALAAWTDDWAPRHPIEIHVECVAELPSGVMFQHWRSDLGSVWIRSDRSAKVALRAVVLGADSVRAGMPAQDWGNEIVDLAWRERNEAVCSALLGDLLPGTALVASETLPSVLTSSGSGAVCLTCDALGLQAMADGAIWHSRMPLERDAAVPGSLVEMTPLATALAQHPVQIDVRLGEAKVELTKLLHLRKGDVLRLPQRLDEALTVLCEGRAFASAVLGESHGHKSVQLVMVHEQQPGTER